MRKLGTVFVFLLMGMSMISYSIGSVNNRLFKEYIDHLIARRITESQIQSNRDKLHCLLAHPDNVPYRREALFMQQVRHHKQRIQELEQHLLTLNGLIKLYVQEMGEPQTD